MDENIEMQNMNPSDSCSKRGSPSLASSNCTQAQLVMTGPGSSPPHSSAQPVHICPDMLLHTAAAEGSEYVVQQWMEVNKCGVDARDKDGYTAFHYAAANHHLNVMRVLVDNGADPILPTQDLNLCSSTALHLAAGSNPKPGEKECQAIRETIKYLVEELKLDVNEFGFDHSCPLHISCSSGNIAAIEVLLDQKSIQLDLMDWQKRSILHASCCTGNVELLQLVLEHLEKEAKLSHMLPLRDIEGRTALDEAFNNGPLEMASKLLEFTRNDEYTLINPQLVLDYSQGRETDVIVDFLSTCHLKHFSRRDDGATILHMVTERGWVRAARVVAVKHSSLLNEKDNKHDTPLHYAAARKNRNIVELLMDQEVTEVDAVDKDGCSPLLVAAAQGCSEAFTKLLEKGDLHKTNNEGKNAVFIAAEADHSVILEIIIECDPSSLRQVNEHGNTPLHAAAEHGSERSLRVLLDQHVDVNAHNGDSKTSLHLAAGNGHNRVVESLLAYVPPSESDEATDISARDEYGETALHLAAEGGHSNVAVTLLKKGASIRARNKFSWTPLHNAALGGHQELVEQLISEYDAEVNARNEDQQTPLHYAASNGHSDVVTTLLNHKADVTAVDKDGRNALAVATEERHNNVAMAIVKHDKWRDAMRHTYRQCVHGEEPETTPMRELIRDMPDIGYEVLNNCTKVIGNDPHSVYYEVTFHYELLEDLGDPAVTDVLNGSPEEANRNARVYRQPSGWKCRPSHLLNKLAPRVIKSKNQGTTWGPTVFDKATHPLQLMVQYKRTDLLNHPLVSTLLAYKWKRAWPLYLANVLFYLVFLCFLTAYALVVPNPQSSLCLAIPNGPFANGSDTTAYQCGESSNQPFLYVAGAIVLLCVLVRVIMEFIQFLEQPLHYFCSHENWLEIFLYSLTVIFISSLGSVCVCPKAWQWQIGALAVFLAWIHLSIFVKKLPQFGLYIIMFEDIVLTFIKLAIPALLLVLAFSMAFYMMFFVPNPQFAASPFATPGLSIIKAMTMATAELEFESIFRFTSGGVGDIDEVPIPIPYTGVSILLWIVFLIMMPILLMNLLTGLAVGDVRCIQSEAEFRKLELQIELVLKTEETFQAFRAVTNYFVPQDKCGNKTIKVKPNKHHALKCFLSLLAGVDRNPKGEAISKLLSKPVKKIEIEHVHEQTTTLLAKVAKQEKEQSKSTRLGGKPEEEIGELRMEICELKAAITEQKTEVRKQLKAEMGKVKEDMANLMEEMSKQMIDHNQEMARQSKEMAKQFQLMVELQKAFATRWGGDRASPT